MAEEEEQKQGQPAPKSKKGLIIAVVGGLLVLVGGAVGGAILAPKLLGGGADAHAAEAEGTSEEGGETDAEAEVPEHLVASAFDSIVIDVRSQKGEVHHLKVGLSVELKEGVKEDDFKLLAPRGRAAALSYLRTLTFEEITDPQRYTEIQKELSTRVMAAVGKKKLARVLLVDFVAQ